MPAIEIPEVVGAILLPDCTLFPHGLLPLHIFETRYRAMLTDALEGHCVFCVASLTGEESSDLAACTAPIGTAGLIRASHEMPDGCSELILQGVSRVRFRDWLPDRSFPLARIEALPPTDLEGREAEEQFRRLRDAVERILLDSPGEFSDQIRALFDRSNSPLVMADAVAHQFVREPALRQSLLEEPDLATRIDLVVDYLQSAPPGLS